MAIPDFDDQPPAPRKDARQPQVEIERLNAAPYAAGAVPKPSSTAGELLPQRLGGKVSAQAACASISKS